MLGDELQCMTQNEKGGREQKSRDKNWGLVWIKS